MEYSLHQELKRFYASPHCSTEVLVDGYRVDALSHGWLIEIQHGPLAAIREKVQTLLQTYPVLIVKPIVVEKEIVRLNRRNGQIVSRRRSPKRGNAWEIFHDLVHFMHVFPHPHLRIDVALVDIEELRYPGPRQRWGHDGYRLADRRLKNLRETISLHTASDLRQLFPPLYGPFDSRDLAELLDVPRWLAQRITYCLRRAGAAIPLGRDRHGFHYRWTEVQPESPDLLALSVA